MKSPLFWYQYFWHSDLDLELDLVLKTLTWTTSFEPNVLRLWYLKYRCIMKIPFFWYQDFWPSDLDLKLWPLPWVTLPGELCCLLTTLVVILIFMYLCIYTILQWTSTWNTLNCLTGYNLWNSRSFRFLLIIFQYQSIMGVLFIS
jgi:hypothetical protein